MELIGQFSELLAVHQPWTLLFESCIFACLNPRIRHFLELKSEEVLPLPTLCNLSSEHFQITHPVLPIPIHMLIFLPERLKAAERIQRKQRRKLQHDPSRLIQT